MNRYAPPKPRAPERYPVTFKLETDAVEYLERVAANRGTTRSAYMQELVLRHLRHQPEGS